MAADSSQVVSDVPVGRVAGHVDAILSHAWTGGLFQVLLTGVVEFVLETQGQNVHQLRKEKKKQMFMKQRRKLSHGTNPPVSSQHTPVGARRTWSSSTTQRR